MGKGSKNKKKAKAAAAAAASRGVVGPDYMQVLTGTIASKSVALILCGESHEDAIDVTRSGGAGKIKEGWIDTDAVELTAEMTGGYDDDRGNDDEEEEVRIRVKCGMCKRKDKLLPLGKAKEWANDIVKDEIDYIDHGHELALLYVPSKDAGWSKGKGYVVELFLDDGKEEDKSRLNLPSAVNELLDDMIGTCDGLRGVKSLAKAVNDIKIQKSQDSATSSASEKPVLLQWADLDSEARILNHRRLLGEDIPTSEYDKLITDRKNKRRKEENLWTWDDWLMEVQSKLASQGEDAPALQLVLEGPIPPWEVELCRDLYPNFELCQAADCIRCLSEDSEESELDVHDPSADGFGGYIDYIYRRLMEKEPHDGTSNFLHCVDSRDLGCEHACIADSLHKDWMDLLQPDEQERLLGSGPDADHAHHKDGRWLPDWEHNPEEAELDRLCQSGIIKNDKEDEDGDEEEDLTLITFPSFEGFFGQNSDILYYSPHVKLAYGPFLGECVKSYDNWKDFFAKLFLGGSVEDALSLIDISEEKRPFLHVRSPIMKSYNVVTGEYEWEKRCDEEHDLTFPVLPVSCFLKAKGSNPPRTWSSHLLASLMEDEDKSSQFTPFDVVKWAFEDIEKHVSDPKKADDEVGGGEWFLAYLRQTHREIYDDIDHTDPTELLQKKYAAGESCGTLKKHKIGDISVPSCEEGFDKIVGELPSLQSNIGAPFTLSKSSEVMGKILIDIFMSKLIDISTVLKILQLVSRESKDKIVIVCYLGSVHSRAVCDFFCNRNSKPCKFKKKVFAGKHNWDEGEAPVLHLPAELWNLKQLFVK